jgi:AraC family transcriptional regulator of adaptative response / DNA-3-methyladenine glycosylase II
LSPAPEVVAQLKPEELAALGITKSRCASIISLATAVVAGRLSLEPVGDLEKNTGVLRTLAGIGDWTAQYVAMRALSWPDAFLHSDLGIKKALALSNEKQILNIAEQWRPWRSYASMHLWKSLEK